MTGKLATRQIDETTLNALAQFFQKDVPILIDLYLKDSEKQLSKLKLHIEQQETKHIQRVAKELRQSSLDIGALRFSFIILSLEIALNEHRVQEWGRVLKVIEDHYRQVVDELATLRFAYTRSPSFATS